MFGEMEKLIELGNEYEKTLEPNLQIEWTENGVRATPLLIISKKYGFIKWLVENDKINFKKFDGDNYDYLENPIGSNNYDTVWDYKTIIQWLSISDTPIEDLVSYLK